MGLVDYSSSSSSSDAGSPPAKRRKDADHPEPDSASNGAAAATAAVTAGDMPPLPSAFHDLYASTVRHSVVDDPSLHQGRTRQTPHVVGNWPSHLYVEWHPSTSQHKVLKDLIHHVRAELDGTKIHDFLTSDLGAPLPLHISLSQSLPLPTATKDAFLERVTAAVRSSRVDTFTVLPKHLFWYRAPEAHRTFLVMRVSSTTDSPTQNPELTRLLTRCNAVAAQFGLAELYHRGKSPVGDEFHVSVGWTLEPPDQRTAKALHGVEEQFEEVKRWEIEVGGVKAKIGNVVNHIPLGGEKGIKDTSSLFGL